MAENKFFKKSYTEKEINECFAWFERNMDNLPESLTVGKDMKIPHLAATVKRMVHHLQQQMRNKSIYNGEFANLLYIRQCIREQAPFQEK